MSDEQQPATDLEATVRLFVDTPWPRFTLGNLVSRHETYLVIPETALRSLGWTIDPARPDPGPYVSLYPGMKGGRPTLNRTRLDVETVAEYVWAGHNADEVMHAWEITRQDALVCCWYQGRWGKRIWRQRWRTWADGAYSLLARDAECPWPPTVGTTLAER